MIGTHISLSRIIIQFHAEVDQDSNSQQRSQKDRSQSVFVWSGVLAANHASSLHILPQGIATECNSNRHHQQTIDLRPSICLSKSEKLLNDHQNVEINLRHNRH